MNQQLSLIPLSKIGLKIKAEVWLEITIPPNFLELISPQYQQELKQQFIEEKLSLIAYNVEDLEQVWQLAWLEQLNLSALQDGYKGFKIGDNLIYSENQKPQLGELIKIEINSPKPFVIKWQLSDKIESYNLYDLRKLKISKILALVKLSPNVAYQISEDYSYFQVWIGFKSKKLAASWLRKIKSQLGSLSPLIYCHSPELIHTGKKYEYVVEKFKHKNFNKRLEVLKHIAQLDLDKLPD